MVIGGIHESIASKIISSVGRVVIAPDVTVTGGVANNQAVADAISKKLYRNVIVPNQQQITGALGAA